MWSCDEALERISAALDGALSDGEQAALDEHLSHCPACAALFAELTGIRDAAGSLEEVPAPDGFAERVMERVRAESAQEQPGSVTPFPGKKHTRTHWKRWAATAAVFAVVVLGAVSLPGRISSGGNNSASAPSTANDNNSSVSQNAENSFVRNSNTDSATTEEQESAFDSEPQAGNAEADTKISSQADTFNEPAAAPGDASAACGVLTLRGEALPEGLEDYESTTDDDGNVTYFVPVDYFYACLAQLEAQDAAAFAYRALEAEPAEYGLIIVEAP